MALALCDLACEAQMTAALTTTAGLLTRPLML